MDKVDEFNADYFWRRDTHDWIARVRGWMDELDGGTKTTSDVRTELRAILEKIPAAAIEPELKIGFPR